MEPFEFNTDYSIDNLHPYYPNPGEVQPSHVHGQQMSMALSQHQHESSPLHFNRHEEGNGNNAYPSMHVRGGNMPVSELDTLLHDRFSQVPGQSPHTGLAGPSELHGFANMPTEVQDNSSLNELNLSGNFVQHGHEQGHVYVPQHDVTQEPHSFANLTAMHDQKMFHPVDVSAITPASVFSTMSSASTNDFLSPITSPMLQPQPNQHMYIMNENENMHLPQNTVAPSPAQIQGNLRSNGVQVDYSLLLKSPANRQAAASSPVTKDKPQMRRSRTSEKTSRIRPSPLMKPNQSPKTTGTQGVWAANVKRDGSQLSSPSLGAIESLTTTVQEAGGLMMPSPVISPNILALKTSQSQGRAVNGNEEGMRQQNINVNVQQTIQENGRVSSIAESKSPSPIDLSQMEVRASPSAIPATPGTLMGLSYSNSSFTEENTESGPSSKQNAVSLPNDSFSSSPRVYGSQDYAGMKGVTFKATRPGPIYATNTAQHKPILPGGLTTEDRTAWMNMRRTVHGGLDQRRTSHKAAEQKRRDSLKHCFDELRGLLPVITVDESVPGGSVLGPDGTLEDQLADGFDVGNDEKGNNDELEKPASAAAASERLSEANRTVAKVLLLRHSNEYLLRLKRRIERRDKEVESLSNEVKQLRAMLASRDPAEAVDSKVSSEMNSLHIGTSQASSVKRAEGILPDA
ncbi:RNA polymerase II cis-regulatory region sequence-specific DNA binding protein [Malassezia pachydermatis]